MTIVLLIALVVFAVILLFVIQFFHRRTSGLDTAYYKKTWATIEELASKKVTWVQAIVDADKLLDEALKQSNFAGNTLADRMVNANRTFSNANNIWTAHKIRNKVVHESKFVLKKNHIKGAMTSYKQALKDLGAL